MCVRDHWGKIGDTGWFRTPSIYSSLIGLGLMLAISSFEDHLLVIMVNPGDQDKLKC